MMKNVSINKSRVTLGAILIIIGVTLRLLLHNNLPSSPSIYITINGLTQPMFMLDLFFVVAVISILSGLILGGYYTFIVPISVMIITDLMIGNNWILLFTWSGFALLGFLGYLLKTSNSFTIEKIPRVLGVGVGGILLYDIWTNFGTWLGGWYTHTFEGLVLCYTYALPFMFWHLLSTTITLSIVIIPIIYLKEHRITLPEFTVTPFEKHTTIAALTFLMILSILSVFL